MQTSRSPGLHRVDTLAGMFLSAGGGHEMDRKSTGGEFVVADLVLHHVLWVNRRIEQIVVNRPRRRKRRTTPGFGAGWIFNRSGDLGRKMMFLCSLYEFASA